MKTLAITFAESEGLTAYVLSMENLEQVAGGTDGSISDLKEAITNGLVKVVKEMIGGLTFDLFDEFEEWYLPREKIIDILLPGYVRNDYCEVYKVMCKSMRKDIRENVFLKLRFDDPDPEMWF